MFCLRNTRHIVSRIEEGLNLPTPLIQSVRGIKPRWIPKSKSKIFYVRNPTPINPEEHGELRIAYFHYRTQLRAIRRFLFDQDSAKSKLLQEQTTAAENRDHAAELQSMEELNNQWNSQIEAIRETAWLEEKEKQEKRTKRWMERDQKKKDERKQKAEAKLERDLKGAESFISLDTLDTEIEKLLNVRQDYNFAIDKQGNRISDGESSVDSAESSSLSEQQQKPVK